MSQQTFYTCDACGKPIGTDDTMESEDLCGFELYVGYGKNRAELQRLFMVEEDTTESNVKELCDECAMKLAECFYNLKK